MGKTLVLLLGLAMFGGTAGTASAQDNQDKPVPVDSKTQGFYDKDFDQWFNPWKIMKKNGLKVRFNKISKDSLQINESLRRYYIIVSSTTIGFMQEQKIDFSGQFSVKGDYGKEMFTSDHEGRDINGDVSRGMYEKHNPGKIKKWQHSGYDEQIVGTDYAFAVSRNIPFAIGEAEKFEKRWVKTPYIWGRINFCFGADCVSLTNLTADMDFNN